MTWTEAMMYSEHRSVNWNILQVILSYTYIFL